MKSQAESRYRLELAEGFLAEALQNFELSRWRSCVDNSQLERLGFWENLNNKDDAIESLDM